MTVLDPSLKVVVIPRQTSEAGKQNSDEVALGYYEEQALAEAERCLQCAKPHV